MSDIVPFGFEVPDLVEELNSLLGQIPCGRVTTYGDLADALGSKAAARWVGECLVDAHFCDDVPDHRVIRSTGELGLHVSRDVSVKSALLQEEAVDVRDGKVDLDRYRVGEFESDAPLARLTAQQHALAQRISIEPFDGELGRIAGVDVSYIGKQRAVAAYVLMDAETSEVIWTTTIERTKMFPYISGFLTYRESPLLLELLRIADASGQRADVVCVDGNGILHPRRAGIASFIGVSANVPTIGIAKKLLCGHVDLNNMPAEEARPITDNNEIVGYALKSKSYSRPVFVSPGHRIDASDAARIVKGLLLEHRLPEPIFLADALSRQVARSEAGSS